MASSSAGSSSHRKKPRIGVVFSHESAVTTTSKDFAVFIGAALQLGGYSEVYFIPFRPTGAPKVPPPPKGEVFTIVPYGGKRLRTADPRECSYQEWSILEQCNVVLLCVGPDETKAAATAYAKLVKTQPDCAVISLQQGVKNSADFKAVLGKKRDSVLLDGAVGISVARHPVDGSYRCLNRGYLVLERLSKADAENGVKFLNLLSTADVPLLYRRTLTPYTWGALLYGAGDAAMAVTGQTARQFLYSRPSRLLWAAMMREGRDVLAKAAAGASHHMEGKNAWEPANPCGRLSFTELEVLLCLPSPFFAVVAWFLLPRPAAGLAPAMQGDLREGRETAARWTLDELLQAGEKASTPMPACEAVREALTAALAKKEGVPSVRPEYLLAECRPSESACHSATSQYLGRRAAVLLIVFAVLWLLASTGE